VLPLENLLERIEKLEKEMEQIKNSLRKKAEERKLKLSEKFDIHDRKENLIREFEAMNISNTWTFPSWKDFEELKTIIKCLGELVDYALGKDFP
jgi:hypothetical protein